MERQINNCRGNSGLRSTASRGLDLPSAVGIHGSPSGPMSALLYGNNEPAAFGSQYSDQGAPAGNFCPFLQEQRRELLVGNGRLIDLNIPTHDPYDTNTQTQSLLDSAPQFLCQCKRKQPEGTATDPILLDDDDDNQGYQGNGHCHCRDPNKANPPQGVVISERGGSSNYVANANAGNTNVENVAQSRSVQRRKKAAQPRRFRSQVEPPPQAPVDEHPSLMVATPGGNGQEGSSSRVPPLVYSYNFPATHIFARHMTIPYAAHASLFGENGLTLRAHLSQPNDLAASIIGGSPMLTAAPSAEQVFAPYGVLLRRNAAFNINASPAAPAPAPAGRLRWIRAPRSAGTGPMTVPVATDEYVLIPIDSVPYVRDSIAAIRQRAPSLLPRVHSVMTAYIEGRANLHLTTRLMDVLQGHAILLSMENNGVEADVPFPLHLDIDRMTREELLALGERFGAVTTGLTEEEIQNRIKPFEYHASENASTEDVGCCCICLEDFVDKDELGNLDCSHEFHIVCITKWLKEKNNCPICKRKALADPI